jgi:membrane protein DedA with SNARE-associated domain
MRSAQRARKISLALSLGVIYPLMLLGDALDWPAGIQFALGVLALSVLVGVFLLLTDWQQWRTDRAKLRRERAARKRARPPA